MRHYRLGVFLVAFGLTSLGLARAARFLPLGNLPGGDFSTASDISADGRTVVGQSASNLGYQAFRWTEESGMIGLGFLPQSSPDSFAWGISADGATIVGEAAGDRSFVWTEANGMQSLPLGSRAFATSNGGTRIVGVGPGVTYGRNVSPDGLFWVGGSSGPGSQAFRTTPGQLSILGDLPGFELFNSATAVTPDGQIVVGQSRAVLDPDGRGFEVETDVAVYWHGISGPFVIGDLPNGGHGSIATDISWDARVIVGAGESEFGSEAFRWTPWQGIRPLRELLLAEGIDVAGMGWQLVRAEAVSADGRFIVGHGSNPLGNVEGFIIELNVPEPSTLALFGGSLFACFLLQPKRLPLRDSLLRQPQKLLE